MKKLVFLFVAMLGMTLTSCSCFDSNPINPKIIGTGNLQHDVKSDTWYVAIDSMQYTVSTVTIEDNSPRSFTVTQDLEPVEGMLVTIFTADCFSGVQAVPGEQSVEQIEELYHTNSTMLVILMGLLAFCLIGMMFPKRKTRIIDADR